MLYTGLKILIETNPKVNENNYLKKHIIHDQNLYKISEGDTAKPLNSLKNCQIWAAERVKKSRLC